jgi:hypothetical protein
MRLSPATATSKASSPPASAAAPNSPDATGLAQAEATARRIARQWKPVAIYTSGLQRCVVTAQHRGACGAPRPSTA